MVLKALTYRACKDLFRPALQVLALSPIETKHSAPWLRLCCGVGKSGRALPGSALSTILVAVTKQLQRFLARGPVSVVLAKAGL